LKFWEVKNKVGTNKVGELRLYGDISNDKFWDNDVTPQQIVDDINALGQIETLNVYINSGGGSVFAGQAIYSILKRLKVTKCAYIDGLAASAASLIPLACDKIYMPSNAMIMIHNPLIATMGNANDLREMADRLDLIRESIINVYQEKTKLSREEIISMMDAETWMGADKALELGFIDEIESSVDIAASIAFIKDGKQLSYGYVNVNLDNYKNFDVSILQNNKSHIHTGQDTTHTHTLHTNSVGTHSHDITNRGESEPVVNILEIQKQKFRKLKNKILKSN
jgi:ATP-dependent Clp protease protease subunit